MCNEPFCQILLISIVKVEYIASTNISSLTSMGHINPLKMRFSQLMQLHQKVYHIYVGHRITQELIHTCKFTYFEVRIKIIYTNYNVDALLMRKIF